MATIEQQRLQVYIYNLQSDITNDIKKIKELRESIEELQQQVEECEQRIQANNNLLADLGEIFDKYEES